MSGIDWDEEFTRMNTAAPEKPSTSSKFSAKIAKIGGVRRNTADRKSVV